MPHHYDPNQPRVPMGHSDGGQWTNGKFGPVTPVHFAPARPRDDPEPGRIKVAFAGALGPAVGPLASLTGPMLTTAARTALPLLAWISARIAPDQQAVLVFRAREYPVKDGRLWVAGITILSREDVQKKCGGLEDVQKLTNEGAAEAQKRGLKGKERGDYVHSHVEQKIKERRENAQTELSLAEDDEKPGSTRPEEKRNKPNSVRVDVYEQINDKTVCIYDMKTGRGGLTLKRIEKIADKAARQKNAKFSNIIVTEVRPTP